MRVTAALVRSEVANLVRADHLTVAVSFCSGAKLCQAKPASCRVAQSVETSAPTNARQLRQNGKDIIDHRGG